MILASTGPSLSAQTPCSAEVNAHLDTWWARYRAQEFDAARAGFADMLAECPGHVDATVGWAYAQLQLGRLDTALVTFHAVRAEHPEYVGAIVGAALTLWRMESFEESLRLFREVLAIEPDHQTALEFIRRIPEVGSLRPRPPQRPTGAITFPSRVHDTHLDVRRDDAWSPFYVKGINLGAALPGKHPAEFPDSAIYATWLEQMGNIGFNTIRVYTIHPPSFYQALLDYNRRHPAAPLWVMHGSWTELPPGGRYDNPAWREAFDTEMRRVVDAVHGRTSLGLSDELSVPFHDADISPWVLAYVIGREWEPSSLAQYSAAHPDRTRFDGDFFRVTGGNPSEALMAELMEVPVEYETVTYGHQRPIAFTSWPTLDPLTHVSEATRDEQFALRAAFGYPVETPDRRAEDDDAITVDASRIQSTDRAPGVFAVFHAYPYYPDFMINDPQHQGVSSPEGPSNYFAYLTRLRQRLPTIPIVIGEYGVPASLTNSHLQPQGWHHGGHTEQEMARINARLTREIAAAGMAGGAFFAWIDEWFKKNWLVIDFEVPLERNHVWFNRLDPEQHYGVLAIEPEPRLGDGPLRERRDAWERISPLYLDRWGTLRATADEAYLHVLFENADPRLPDQLFIGFDMVNPAAGDTRWPDRVGDSIPVGIEFVLSFDGSTTTLMADQASNPIEVLTIQWTVGDTAETVERVITSGHPPGMFRGRVVQQHPDSVVTVANDDGVYERLRVVTNDLRIGRDTIEYAGAGYDRGILAEGQAPDGLWEVVPSRGVVEFRIPWTLLNVTDPSQRRVLQGAVRAAAGEFQTILVPDIGIVATARDGGHWRSWPVPSRPREVARFTWDTWDAEDVLWRFRQRPVADTLLQTLERLRTPSLDIHR